MYLRNTDSSSPIAQGYIVSPEAVKKSAIYCGQGLLPLLVHSQFRMVSCLSLSVAPVCIHLFMFIFSQVSQESIYNRMTASSLACVFGLNLIWPSKGPASLSALVPLNLFTELLIDFYMNIFNSRTVPGEILP